MHGLRKIVFPVFPDSELTADSRASVEFTFDEDGRDQSRDDFTLHYITAIRESLGPAYFAFLIVLSTRDFETAGDLAEFEDRLRADWSQEA